MNSDKIIVGPFGRGLNTTVEPFYVDNESFPVLVNAYQWRGRVKRKRGTQLLGRLNRFFQSTSTVYSSTSTILLNGSGQGNVLSGFGLEATANLVPGTGVFFSITSGQTYRDLFTNSFLLPTGTNGPNRINYSSGVITIPVEAGSTLQATFNYFPGLPVLGIEDLNVDPSLDPGTVCFDNKYSYNVSTTDPYNINDVSFYKNVSNATYPGYIAKGNWTKALWAGQDYQQYWSKNYQGALWVTNGLTVPFNSNSVGMQFKPIVTVTITAPGPPAIATLNIVGHGLVVGDFLFINEVVTTTGINFQTGYLIAVIDADNISVEFPNATLALNGTGGIAQYLTNTADTTKDCIRWYDGDPTDGNPTSPTFLNGKGWVNFMPPLSRDVFSISDLPALKYYLVGARMIWPFKDRLIFIGPIIQSSTTSPVYLQDTVVFSQNGTPFYTSSFTGDSSLSTTIFNPILVPKNQTATANAYWEDQTGFGGFIQAGIEQPIVTSEKNEDVIILGCPGIQMRFIYTGNDLLPFNFYLIDSDLSTTSTFSSINMGSSVITRGEKGIISTNQREAKRIDLEILDENFEVGQTLNGSERYTSQRDYLNEWIYLTYRSNQDTYRFPTVTLQYNYRDSSWGLFKETYTHYGQFRKKTGYTWATIGNVFDSWEAWNTPWNSGASTLLTPDILAGNQHGFLLIKIEGTSEGNSVYIKDYSNGVVTSPNHCLNPGDYIIIKGAAGITGLNNNIYSVAAPVTNDTFKLNPKPSTSGTYYGNGSIRRMYVPFIQTKQFPAAWSMGRKTRIGVQKYLITTTKAGKITLEIYLSENSATPFNRNTERFLESTALIYNSILPTCAEAQNLSPFPPPNANYENIMMFVDNQGVTQQSKIWHRINTSLVGDTVQLAFTMNDAQMRDTSFQNQFAEIELHGFILDIYPSQLLC